mmetsp:Transcript_34152/g.86701  ORF Transcript_34152/g.86701 Transcript_34152/m.86701 type:complete len:212 (-) Transcript_34152:299-934(-)
MPLARVCKTPLGRSLERSSTLRATSPWRRSITGLASTRLVALQLPQHSKSDPHGSLRQPIAFRSAGLSAQIRGLTTRTLSARAPAMTTALSWVTKTALTAGPMPAKFVATHSTWNHAMPTLQVAASGSLGGSSRRFRLTSRSLRQAACPWIARRSRQRTRIPRAAFTPSSRTRPMATLWTSTVRWMHWTARAGFSSGTETSAAVVGRWFRR